VTKRSELIDAVVPLLSFNASQRSHKGDFEKAESFLVQLSLGSGWPNENSGIRSTHLLFCYGRADPRIVHLVVLVKAWANFHALVGARWCRLSSHALALMVIFFLQRAGVAPVLQKEYPDLFAADTPIVSDMQYVVQDQLEALSRRRRAKPELDLGRLTKWFFSFYSSFDFSKVISVRTGTSLSCEHSKRDSDWGRSFCRVEDPFGGHNVARATFCRVTWLRIQRAISETDSKLQALRALTSIFFEDAL